MSVLKAVLQGYGIIDGGIINNQNHLEYLSKNIGEEILFKAAIYTNTERVLGSDLHLTREVKDNLIKTAIELNIDLYVVFNVDDTLSDNIEYKVNNAYFNTKQYKN